VTPAAGSLPDDDTTWSAVLVVPVSAGPAFEEALALDDAGTSSFVIDGTANCRIEAYYGHEPDSAFLHARVAAAALAMGLAVPALTIETLAPRDWVAQSLKEHEPVHAGRFFVHGAHARNQRPAGALSLEIAAGRAFGTGQHATTRGCLLMIDALAKRHRFERPLDLGCGSGVLGLAMAGLWRRHVIATDIDPWAVRMTREHAALNGLTPWITAVEAAGFDHPVLRMRQPFDLIVANILARPLQALAPDIVHHAGPGAVIVLAGLLNHQARAVAAAYRNRGLRLDRRLEIGGWTILMLTAPA